MSLRSMRHKRTTRMPVISLSESAQFVTAPGVTEVKRPSLR